MPPTKRRKVGESQDSVKKIVKLEEDLTAAIKDGKSLNALADLLAEAKKSTGQPQRLHKAIYALYRVFSLLTVNDWFHSSGRPSEENLVVRKWLQQRLDQYLNFLLSLFEHSEPLISQSAAQIPFSLLKQLSSSLSSASGHPQLHSRTFRLLIPQYLSSSASLPTLIDLVDKHDDIRWFTLREISGLLRSKSSNVDDQLVENVLQLLESTSSIPKSKSDINSFYINELGKTPKDMVTPIQNDEEEIEDEDDWRTYFETKPDDQGEQKATPEGRSSQFSTHKALHSVQSHRAQFSAAWLALLQHIKNSQQQSTRVLSILHRSILPHLTQPVQLMDWIGACVDFGGSIALLGLNALFVLIQEHNLDYPDFYTRLYALLDRNILHVRYRARFFRLLELFLSSTHLPATLLASFAKRLARLSLNAPPPAIIMVIPFIYNILKRHPSLMSMIHRVPDDESSTTPDPFLVDEPSPLLTNAISSSLWELNTHTTHYAAPVSTMARIFSEPFTKPSYVQEDFLDHTYGTLYTSESKRKIVQEPALSMTLDFTRSIDVDASWDDIRQPCDLWIWDT